MSETTGQRPIFAETPIEISIISIVIINHNYAAFLARAVDSALAQSYPNVEVVVVDDGSTDRSLAILEEYRDRIRLVSKANAGHVSAVNAGMAASTGSVLIFLDADDLLYPGCVTRVMANWRPDLTKLQFRLDTIDGKGIDQGMPFPAYAPCLTEAEIRRRALLTGYYPWPVSSGNAFSRVYLQQVTPINQREIFKSPDGYLNKMAPLYGPVLTLREILGAYRVHGGNAWAQSSESTRAEAYVRGTQFDAVLHQAFVKAADRFGHQVPHFDHAPVPQWIEVRLLSLRLVRDRHPFSGDSIAKVWWIGIRAALSAPGMTSQARALWIGWFTVLAVSPRNLVASMTARFRPQSRRSRFARRVISKTRGFRS